MAKGLAQYFDISEQDRLDISFRSTTADKTMIFSGPPTFALLGTNQLGLDDVATSQGSTNHVITPLSFSTTFTVTTSRTGSGEYPVIGSPETFTTPSTHGSVSIGLGAYSLVSGDPTSSTGATTGSSESPSSKYTLLKRLYYDIIQYNNGSLVDHFISDGGTDTASGFKPVAMSKDDLFMNFAHSEFYEMEFGILRITLTKGNEGVIVSYYENCRLQGGLNDSTRAGGQSQFQPNVNIVASKEVPLNFSIINDLSYGKSDNGFMAQYKAYLNGTPLV